MDQALNIQPLNRKWMTVTLDPRLFPLHIVFFAAHELLTELVFRIQGDPEKQLRVRITPRGTDMPVDYCALIFQQKLIEVSLKENRWHQKADIREYLLASAIAYDHRMLDMEPNLINDQKVKLLEALTYQINTTEDNHLNLSIGIGRNKFDYVRLKLFEISNRLKQFCYFFPTRLENGHILCSSYPKNGADMSIFEKRMSEELNILDLEIRNVY